MTALHEFIQAAASYYGVPLDQLMEGSTLDTTQGDLEVVLRVALTPEDVAAIATRMQRMALERKVDEQQAAKLAEAEQDSAELATVILRTQWNSLPRSEKSRFGSFGRFKAMGGVLLAPGTEVELPPHVYLPPSVATEQQKAMAVGRDARGWFAIDPADLTEQQRARHLGVTSDATDFGGLPG